MANDYNGYDSRDDDREYTHGDRGHYGNTSSFSTTMISDDGRFLGIKLSSELASDLRRFSPLALDWGRRKVEKFSIPLTEKLAKILGASEHRAQHYSGKVANFLGYATILAPQAEQVGRNIFTSIKALYELKQAVKPLAQSADAGISGDNEVLANARKKVSGIFWHQLMMTATSAIGAIPNIAIKFGEQGIKNHAQSTQRALEKAKTTDEYMAILEKEITPGALKKGANPEIMRDATERLIEKERTKYHQEFEQFRNKHAHDTQRELEKILDNLTETNVAHRLDSLKKHGFDVGDLEWQLRQRGSVDKAAVLNEFKQVSREHIADYVENKLSHRFNETTRDLRTREQEIRSKIEGLEEAREHTHRKNEESEHNSEVGKMGANLAAGVGAEWMTQKIGGKALEQYAQPVALDRILHLRREMEKTADRPLEHVPGIAIGQHNHEEDTSYVQYVHKIFERHQQDSGRPEIGERFFEHFEKARWDDEAIQQLPDDELTTYEYAVKTIAKRIKDGRMDALALVDLVGDKRKKIVGDNGRTFGPAGSGDDEAKSKEAVLKLIDEKTAILYTNKDQTDAQINDKLGNFVFSIEDLKKTLESKDLDASQRAFVFTVFSDVMGSDRKLCKKLGIDAKRCQELRKECKQQFTAMLDGAVNVLADMIQNEPEKLDKQLKMTEKEKELIVALANESRTDGKDVADMVKNREELNLVERSVANAAMALGKSEARGDGNNFWQRLVTAMRQPKKAPEPEASAPAQAHLAESEALPEKHENITPASRNTLAPSASHRERIKPAESPYHIAP